MKSARVLTTIKDLRDPRGNIVTVGSERFRCREVFFQSSCIVEEAIGIHNTVFQYILKGDVEIRKGIYGDVVLSGGATVSCWHS